MSIATEITRLQNAKAALKTALESINITIPSSATLDEYADLILNPQSGNSGSSTTKIYSFNGLEIAPAPLYYGANGFEIKDSDWNHDSYGTIKGKNEGSYAFSFIDLGTYFDSDGSNFVSSSGSIDNTNKITYNNHSDWRVPTANEIKNFTITTSARNGSTVNGNSNIHYALLQLTGVTHANNSSPIGLLVFPDDETITGVALSNLDNSTVNANITNAQLNSYLEQGCAFFPASGNYFTNWQDGGVVGAINSVTDYDGSRQTRLVYSSGSILVGASSKEVVYWQCRLVRSIS